MNSNSQIIYLVWQNNLNHIYDMCKLHLPIRNQIVQKGRWQVPTKVVEKFGTAEKLREKLGGEDPIEWARAKGVGGIAPIGAYQPEVP